MNQAASTEIKSALLDSDGNEFRDSDNQKPLTESSKEQIIMEEYELSNIAIQEQFFFDAGEKRIISVNVIIKSEALYINVQEDGEKLEHWFINPRDLVGAATNFPKRKIRFSVDEIIEVYELKFYYYSKIKKTCSRKCYRVFSEKKLYHSNYDVIKKWSDLMLLLSKDKDFLKSQANKSLSLLQVYERKRLLVLVNPRGGSGKARQICNGISPNLEKSGYELEVLSTQFYRHAYEYIKHMDQSKLLSYFAIITISGDGLSHEVINALFHRNDWEKIKDIPIGFLPGGSANAMTRNVCHFSKEQALLENMVYIVAKGEKRELDVIKFEIEGEPPIYGMLSMEWAIIGDIDLESEVIRCFGGMRFTMWAVLRWLKLRRYHARLSFTSEDVVLNSLQEDLPQEGTNGWNHIDDIFVHYFIGNVPYISQSDKVCPLSQPSDGFMDLQFMRGRENVGKWKTLRFLLRIDSEGSVINVEEGRPWENSGMEYHKIKAFRLEPYGDALGNLAIDGERYPVKKMQGIVLPKAIKIISL